MLGTGLESLPALRGTSGPQAAGRGAPSSPCAPLGLEKRSKSSRSHGGRPEVWASGTQAVTPQTGDWIRGTFPRAALTHSLDHTARGRWKVCRDLLAQRVGSMMKTASRTGSEGLMDTKIHDELLRQIRKALKHQGPSEHSPVSSDLTLTLTPG